MIKQLSAMAIAILCLGAISCEKDKEEEKTSSETQDSRLMGTWRLDSTLFYGSGDGRREYGLNVACSELTDPEGFVEEVDFSSLSQTSTDCYLLYNNDTEEYELFSTSFPAFWMTKNDSIYKSLFSTTPPEEDGEYYEVNDNKLNITSPSFTFGDTIKTRYYTKL